MRNLKHLIRAISSLFIMSFLMAACSSVADQSLAPFPKYPNGVLTEHFGILEESDLKDFYDKVTVHKSLTPMSPYSQWICSEKANFKLIPLASDNPQKPNYESEIRIVNKVGTHIYSQRRGVVFDRGQAYKKWYEDISEGQTQFCVAGSLVSIDKKTRPHTFFWIWDTVKTKKGYMDFFFKDWKRSKL